MKHAVHRSSRSKRAVPALLAVGGSLVAAPAAALELGEITVHSNLGQPLRASIAVALAPNESLINSCVSIGPAASGLPGVGPATVSVANGTINITGATPIREPMVSVKLVVNCPYAPNLSREYMMFVDPPAYDAPRAAEAAAATSRTVAPSTSVVPTPAPQSQARTESRPAPVADIAQGERYRVQSGESLSEIASRIENRTTSLWPTVNALFAANPDAFIDNDPNKLKAGSWLTIPASLGNAVAAAEATPVEPTPAPAETIVEPVSDDAYSGSDSFEETTVEATVVEEMVAEEPVEMTGDLQPGDVVVSDNPFVEPQSAETVIIPDTQLDGPETTSSSPNASTQIVVPRAETTTTNNWVWWFGGAGIVAILGLLFFSRRSRQEPAPYIPPVTDTPQRRFSDTTTTEALVVEEMEFDPDAGYEIDDDSPTEENLVLDADLVTGTGLEDGSEVDVNQDFGYAASDEVDIELPFEPVAEASEETDVLPPPQIEESSILKSEVLPGAEDDYDMSVIVDATKMPQPDEVTERDLKAIEVRPDDETMIAENYTISREVDYEILEQDYEDEMTATQALNSEIARAAAELAERMEEDEDESGETAVLPMASVTELDVTAEMPAANSDEVVELDATAEMPVESDESADSDETAEMQIESGKSG